MENTINKKITTLRDGKRFIKALKGNGLIYHFDDGAIDCLFRNNLCTKGEAKKIDMRVDELYGLKWGEFECPIGYVLHLENLG